VRQLKLENYQCYIYYSVLARKFSRQQTTTYTTTNTQTTTIDQDGGPGSAISLQSDCDVTSCSSDFRFATSPRRRKLSGVLWAEVWSILMQTAAGAVVSFSQTFPAGIRVELMEAKPASWRQEFSCITCAHFTQYIIRLSRLQIKFICLHYMQLMKLKN